MTRRLLLLASLSAFGAAADEETPWRRVELLLSLPHGLQKLSPSDRARLAKARENPAAHVAVLNALFHPGWAPRAKTGQARAEEVVRLQVALLLAGELKTPEADAFSAGWYLRLAPEGSAPGPWAMARACALGALGERRNEQVVEYVLSHLEWVDDAHRAQMLGYLAKAYRDDVRVIAWLRAVVQARNARFDPDPDLARVLAWMEKG